MPHAREKLAGRRTTISLTLLLTSAFAIACSETTAIEENAVEASGGFPPSGAVANGAASIHPLSLQAQQLQAQALNSSGNSLSPSFSWSATGGTITQLGLFTAGDVSGGFEVVAQETAGLSDTATVTVTKDSTDDGGGPGRITGIVFHEGSVNSFNNGTDLWPITWADDNNLYTAGGDGDGWDGIDTRGMDVNRLTGPPTGNLRANGTELFSKAGVLPKGLISVGGVLYLLEQERENGFARSRIGKSTDHGVTWTYNGNGVTTWDFTGGAFSQGHFINYGKDNAQARDGYVYLTGMERTDGSVASVMDQIVLARVPNTAIQDVSQYKYFSGTAESPAWSSNIANRRPAFSRNGKIHWGAVISYNPVLDGYLLTFFIGKTGTLAVYEGPEPWGPWTKIHEAQFIDANEKHSVRFVNKNDGVHNWLSDDGLTWWFTWSAPTADKFNVAKATLRISQ